MQLAIKLGGGGDAELSALNTEVSTPPELLQDLQYLHHLKHHHQDLHATKPKQNTGLPEHPQFSDADIKKL